MVSTPGFEPGPHWWEASALTTAPPLLPIERKGAVRLCLLVFSFHLAKYIIISEHLVPFYQCPVWDLKRA